jgi:hypothetical protein
MIPVDRTAFLTWQTAFRTGVAGAGQAGRTTRPIEGTASYLPLGLSWQHGSCWSPSANAGSVTTAANPACTASKAARVSRSFLIAGSSAEPSPECGIPIVLF